ncbi:ATP-binding cassette domain-containing protein [Deinococcus deserti]|uniref:Putative ABC transporter, ATP-binding component n=1 Tax=Deinococcus deserti (strain DSM 17065 / CIP 109153 / LMG 22923 / VCD115) TaxID=546414 RepID=C1D160_DEIDV|nr:ATP-binding cassette domain-containing protein [Deinococcus deserti]ACO45584.1 putative ABC transporter, ATP-binding component [Deinococcus deserti VCD115]
MRPLVDLHAVTVRAGGDTLLSDVTLQVQRGEALRLWGPNGGGKTTLLRLLAGQVAPVEGLRTYGLRGGVQHSAVQARQTLGVVGPDAEAFYLTRDWAQTVQDVLLSGFEGELLNLWDARPEALQRLEEVSVLTGLTSLLTRDFRTLSHGQRRRAILARALMAAPELLLLDEFTDGLSEGARAGLSEVLTNVHKAGVAIVLATHRPEEAPELSWRSVHVQGGRIVDEPATSAETSLAPTLPRPPGSAPLVQLDHAEVYRNGHLALGPLSWSWNTGQHWLVTGENGSGKSTLARLIAGEFHAALGGQVTRPFLTRDLLTERRRSVGLVSAELGMRQRREWTGRDLIGSAFAGTEGFSELLSPAQEAQVEALAAQLGVTGLLSRHTETLSQGQLRRLLLARAVVHGPRLLILDEGLDFLDASSRTAFLALLPDLAAKGTHVMVVAHRASDAPPGLTHHLHLDHGQAVYSRALQPARVASS